MIAASDFASAGKNFSGTVIDETIEILEKIGEGGMGAVYKANHRAWNQMLAVKVPRDDLFEDYVDRERWILEAHTWIDLGLHPNIVSCFFIHQWDGIPLLFLDYLPGGSLKEEVREGRLKPGQWPRLLQMAIDICDGLGHAHSLGVIHRDIKPANLLLDSSGRVHVTDFGLVKVRNATDVGPLNTRRGGPAQLDESMGITTTGTVVGTPQYAAPEQWLNEHNIGPATDIYALGVVLFELCVGRLPFDPPSGPGAITHLLIGHLHTAPPVPSDLEPSIPPALSQLILDCLAKTASDRPPSTTAIRHKLAQIYNQVTGQAPRAQPQAAAQRADALNNKGVSLWNLNKKGDAFVAWASALKLDPLHPESVYNRSLGQWMEGQLDPNEVVRRLRQVKATYQRAASYLGSFLLMRGEPSGAEVALKEALQLPEVRDDSRVWRALGDAQMCTRHFIGAQDSYRQALQISPQQPDLQQRLDLALTHADSSSLFPSSKPVMSAELGRAVQALAFGGRHVLAATDSRVVCIDGGSGQTVWTTGEVYDHKALAVLQERDLVIAMMSPNARFYRLSTGELLHQRGEDQKCLAVHPSRNLVLVGQVDLQLIRLDDWQPVARMVGHEKQVQAACFSSNGKLLLTGSCDREPRLWDTETGTCLKVFPRHGDFVDAVAITGDGSMGLSGGREPVKRKDRKESDRQEPPPVQGVVRLWQLESGECFDTWSDIPGEVRQIQLSRDKRWGVVYSHRNNVDTTTIWDMTRGVKARQLDGRAYLSHDGFFLLIPKDHQLDVCRLDSLCNLRAFPVGKNRLTAMAEAPDGRYLAMGTQTGTVSLWEFSELTRAVPQGLHLTRARSYGDQEQVRQDFRSSLQKAHKARESRDYKQAYRELLAARSVTGYNRDPEAMDLSGNLLETLTRRVLSAVWEQRTMADPGDQVTSQVVWLKDGSVMSVGGKFLRQWDLRRGSCTTSLVGHSEPISSLHVNHQQRLAISCGRSVRLWELDRKPDSRFPDGKKRLSLIQGAIWVHSDPQADLLCTLLRSGELHWIHVDSETQKKSVPVPGITAIDCTEDWRVALLGGSTGEPNLSVWNLLSHKRTVEPKAFKVSKQEALYALQTTAVRVSREGRFGLTGGLDYKLRLWDLEDGRCLRTLEGHTGKVAAISLTADSRTAASAGQDGTICIWDLGTGMLLKKLVGPWGRVTAVELSPEGRFLVTAGTDKSIRVWEMDWELDSERGSSPLSRDYPRKNMLQRFLSTVKGLVS